MFVLALFVRADNVLGYLRPVGFFLGTLSSFHHQQLTALCNFSFPHTIGHPPEVADPHEALGENVLEKTPKKLWGSESHHSATSFICIVLDCESHSTVFQRSQSVI